jgi:hypothetical protein
MSSPTTPIAATASDYTPLFHSHYEQVRQIQREVHSSLQSHSRGTRNKNKHHLGGLDVAVDSSVEGDGADPLQGVQLSKKELEVYNRLLNDEGEL